MTFLIYHSGFDTGVKEGPYDPHAKAGVDVLVRSMREAGRPKNVYAELGSTWRFVMRDPDQAAHLMGKLLLTFGEDNILWGTDSIWYGSPQDQIQAFRAFEISREFQDRFGYPALTPAIKRKVFGLNAARVYGLEPTAMRRKLARDRVKKARDEYLNDPQPSFETYGPRTRREFLALRELLADVP
jgi:predicted TIM-barrel fold metal-dependent hydrolase